MVPADMVENGETTNHDDGPGRGSKAASALERLQARPLMLWLAVLGITLVAFYLMDHLIMAGQGLPLNIDLSPAQ